MANNALSGISLSLPRSLSRCELYAVMELDQWYAHGADFDVVEITYPNWPQTEMVVDYILDDVKYTARFVKEEDYRWEILSNARFTPSEDMDALDNFE